MGGCCRESGDNPPVPYTSKPRYHEPRDVLSPPFSTFFYYLFLRWPLERVDRECEIVRGWGTVWVEGRVPGHSA